MYVHSIKPNYMYPNNSSDIAPSTPFSPVASTKVAVFKEKHGVWNPLPELNITRLIVIVSHPPPLQRERG